MRKLATAAVATALVLLRVPVLDVVAGLALALVLPGYALVGVVSRGRRWSPVERIVLVPALSLAVLVLGGIVLYVARTPLATPAWALLSGGVAIVATPFAGPRTAPRFPARLAVPVVVAALILGAAGWVSLRSAAEQRDAVAVTSLSMLPAGDDVRIDVATEHAPPASYRLVVAGPGGFRSTLAPPVGSNGQWARDLAVPSGGRVTADLYRGDSTIPLRSVFLDQR
ncbi:MAG TPA: hypothetical protein VGF84_18415 [Micromonosporaceae bacterium]